MTDREDNTVEEADGDDATRREGAGAVAPRPARGEADHEPHLPRGTLVGRYVVLDVLGEGGMGVVYRAFDPELDRMVAVKLLQATPGGSTNAGGGQAWLLREAQALARLSHPNFVAVHDVGSLPGDQVFVAMELVAGQTLREWLKAAPRPWRGVMPIMLEAGAGLAAAHHAHLIHRDFKPDNVIVGEDGRARVMDFGLARLGGDDAEPTTASRTSDLQIEIKSPLSQELTIAGTVVGTPAYMAPELYRGDGAGARSDQFAFGVALYEALFRARPYKRDELKSDEPTKPKAPPDNHVPASIVRVVMRAISLDPAQRYPSMDALLAELAVDPTRRKRLLFAAGGAVAVAAAIVIGTAMVSRSATTHAVPCKGIEHRLDGVWDPATKQTVRAAFDATKRPFAKQAFAGLERALDGYAQSWTAASVESCEATRVRRDQTEEVLALRQACLDERLEELRAVTQLLATADAPLVDKGDSIAWELDPIATCANVAVLMVPGLPAPEIRSKVTELDKRIASARAQLIAAKYVAALAVSSECIDEATKLGYQPSLALALAVRGGALMATGNLDDGIAAYRDATWAAIRGKRDDIAADSAVTTATLLAEGKKKPDEARIWLGFSDATARRAGVDHVLDIKRLAVEGMIDDAAGDLGAGVTAQEKAFAIAEHQYGHDDPRIMTLELTFGGTLMRAGAWGKAAPHLEHVLKLREASVGPDHPDIALILSNLGACYRHVHDLPKAHAAFERSLAIRERFYGKNSPMLITTLDNFGEYLREVGDNAAALASMERARKLAFIVPGPTSETYHQLLTDYADTYVAAGKLAEAKHMFDDAFALELAAKSTILPISQTSRAELALVEHAWVEAASFADKAIAGFEATGGKDNPALWRPLAALANARIGQGKPAEAKPLLERAIAIGEKSQIDAGDLVPARTALASLSPR